MGVLRKQTNCVWCGFYLGPAPSHKDTGWMGQRGALEGQGWGLVPYYLGQEITGPGSHATSGPRGVIDAGNAASLMLKAGFKDGYYVYLDLENGAPFPTIQQQYVSAWTKAVQASGHYHPGVYCSHTIAAKVHAVAAPGTRLCVFRSSLATPHPVTGTNFPAPDPTGASPYATIWQRDMNAKITVAGKTTQVDLCTASSPTPAL